MLNCLLDIKQMFAQDEEILQELNMRAQLQHSTTKTENKQINVILIAPNSGTTSVSRIPSICFHSYIRYQKL